MGQLYYIDDATGGQIPVSTLFPLPTTGGGGGGGGSSLADTLWVDGNNVLWIRQDFGATITWRRADTNATGTPTAPFAPVGHTSNRTASGTLQNVNETVTIAVGDRGGLGIVIPAFATGTVIFEGTVDGSRWDPINVVPLSGGDRVSQIAGPYAGGTWEAIGGGILTARVRVTVALNTSITVPLLATDDPRLMRVWSTSARNLLSLVHGSDDGGTTARVIRTDPNGNIIISNKTTITGANATVGAATTLDLLSGVNGGWVDVSNFQTISLTVITDGTHATGAITFEQTDDTSAPAASGLFVYNDQSLLVAPVSTTGALGANVANKYSAPILAKFVRVRLSAAPTAGNIRVTATLSQQTWSRPVYHFRLSDGTNQSPTMDAANRRGFFSLTDGTNTASVKAASTPAAIADLGAVVSISPNSYAPVSPTDVASAALTTTTTTTAITPTGGTTYEVNIPVTAVTGTSPTLDVGVEESDDGGTNWFRVYDFPRITAVGMYRSPKLPLTGNRIRYVQTVGGTTPSFTRAVNRIQAYDSAPVLRQLIDRSVVLTTSNSTTPSLNVQQTRNVQMVVNVGAITTTAPALQLEGSDDNGASWYSIGTPLTAVASSTVQVTVNNVQAGLLRARVSTAGVGVTAGYVLIKGF